MKYPDDFNTPAFPAGRFVAVSRFMGTAVMIIFLAIVCICGIMLWVKKTQNVSPFLIYMNPNGERWTMVAHNNHETEIPAYYVLQESLLNKFTRDWFTIYDTDSANTANWAKCDRSSPECREASGDVIDTCAIYCATNESVYDEFEHVVLPVYSSLESDEGDVWTVTNINIKPVDSMKSITENGGFWRLNTSVQTKTGTVYFTGYARIERDQKEHPKTMGYFISEFYTYRMN